MVLPKLPEGKEEQLVVGAQGCHGHTGSTVRFDCEHEAVQQHKVLHAPPKAA